MAIANANGLAELAGNLYVTSRDGEVYRLPIATGKMELAFKTRSALSARGGPAARAALDDLRRAGFTGGTVTAFTPGGEVKYTLKQVANPLGVAVNGDRLAVADYDAGKVRFFDIHDPAAPVAKQLSAAATGRMVRWPPTASGSRRDAIIRPHEVIMDLDEAGRLALLDGGSRPMVFAADGTNLYMGNAQFGNAPFWARFPGEDNVSRFFDPSSRVSWTDRCPQRHLAAGSLLGAARTAQGGNSTIGFFKYQGKVYGVMRYTTPDATKRPAS